MKSNFESLVKAYMSNLQEGYIPTPPTGFKARIRFVPYGIEWYIFGGGKQRYDSEVFGDKSVADIMQIILNQFKQHNVTGPIDVDVAEHFKLT